MAGPGDDWDEQKCGDGLFFFSFFSYCSQDVN